MALRLTDRLFFSTGSGPGADLLQKSEYSTLREVDQELTIQKILISGSIYLMFGIGPGHDLLKQYDLPEGRYKNVFLLKLKRKSLQKKKAICSLLHE